MTDDQAPRPERKPRAPRPPRPERPAKVEPKPRPPRPPRTPRPQGQAEWGFAKRADGTLVIRNWYFNVAAGFLTGLFFLVTLGAPLVFIFALLAAWAWYLEWQGVEIRDGKITYPVRLGIPMALLLEVVPLSRTTLDLSEVSSASTSTINNTTSEFIHDKVRVAHLTGDFGATKIVFDSKAGRDRLFSILKDHYPHITIHRWT